MNVLLPFLPQQNVCKASSEGIVGLLQHFKDSGAIQDPMDSETAMIAASRNGHIDVLDLRRWTSGVKVAVRIPQVRRGRVDVLEWWKNSGLRFGYSKHPMESASKGRLDVLDWWRRSGLSLEPGGNGKRQTLKTGPKFINGGSTAA
ncbi:hypothetical protein BJ742DRAFT_914020 [Cladochytrium replicatum]|nr:hypothetical protein BJ742DRAFT_914020 [Cladochytrium replicatum]